MKSLTDLPLTPDRVLKRDCKPRTEDRTILSGYILLAVSAGLFGLEEYVDVTGRNDDFTIFFVRDQDTGISESDQVAVGVC